MHCLAKILIPSLILVLSCGKGNRTGTSNLYGKAGEVLIVMSDEAWAGSPGTSCRDLFSRPYEILPQYEPIYDVVHINFGSYRDFFLLHRNILVASISPNETETSMQLQEHTLASSQLVIRLLSPDDSSFIQLLAGNGEKILALLANAEKQRIIDANNKNADLALADKIRSYFGIFLTVPMGYQTALDTTDFLWLQKETNSVIQGILIYTGRKPDLLEDLTVPYLIRYRDELLQQFVLGSAPDSYMTTEKEFAPVESSYSQGDSLLIMEIRGLWRMENGISMGGPFLSLTRYDVRQGDFITVEGFVFAAGFSKRNYMRELEAIISTLK